MRRALVLVVLILLSGSFLAAQLPNPLGLPDPLGVSKKGSSRGKDGRRVEERRDDHGKHKGEKKQAKKGSKGRDRR